MSHTLTGAKHTLGPKTPESEDDDMAQFREIAENKDSIVVACPVCDEEYDGEISIKDGDVRWVCPDCGPCNLTWCYES